MRTAEEIEELARLHCEYLITVFRKGFMDGFTHGYKHGIEDKIGDNRK